MPVICTHTMRQLLHSRLDFLVIPVGVSHYIFKSFQDARMWLSFLTITTRVRMAMLLRVGVWIKAFLQMVDSVFAETFLDPVGTSFKHSAKIFIIIYRSLHPRPWLQSSKYVPGRHQAITVSVYIRYCSCFSQHAMRNSNAPFVVSFLCK